jgi:hypothetical protein
MILHHNWCWRDTLTSDFVPASFILDRDKNIYISINMLFSNMRDFTCGGATGVIMIIITAR